LFEIKREERKARELGFAWPKFNFEFEFSN
jgi:hypothetical protein